MEYLILNEESIPFKSIEDCNTHLTEFFNILIDAFRHNMKTVRVSETFNSGWFNLEIAEEYYVRDWIKSQKNDPGIRIKTIIDKTESPQIPISEIEANGNAQLSDFSLYNHKEIKTPSLGAAALLDQVAISFRSSNYWDCSEIELVKIILNKEGEIEESLCHVKNAAQLSHWKDHLSLIKAERKESCRKGNELWKQKNIEFENLIFCKSTEKKFKQLNINKASYGKLWDNLKKLNNIVCECRNDDELKEKTKLNFSDESESVKNNMKLNRFRMFLLPDGSRKFFGLHIKNFPFAMRMHFYPDYVNHKIYIGYFGKHLPTKGK